MARIAFQDISFCRHGDAVRARFLKIYYFDIPGQSLERIAAFAVKDGALCFQRIDERRARKKLDRVLAAGFAALRSSITGRRAVYVHRNSGIPLIGSGAFGIIDRGTTLIEVKPITGCNLKCIYCSVDGERRAVDFVVEPEYLIDELRKVVGLKGSGIEVHISSQGEPLLYEPLAELIRGIKSLPGVAAVSIDTNGTLLTERKVDELVGAGLTRFHISLNALDSAVAEKMAGCAYDSSRLAKLCRYIASKCEIIITPVLLHGVNGGQMPRLIQFAKSLKTGQKAPLIGIQNFLNYRFGRNPAKELPMDEFFAMLGSWEQEYGVKLVLCKEDFGIREAKQIPNPFRAGMIVQAAVLSDGRMPGEKIAAAKGRAIAVPGCNASGRLAVRITRTKHNIILGEPA